VPYAFLSLFGNAPINVFGGMAGNSINSGRRHNLLTSVHGLRSHAERGAGSKKRALVPQFFSAGGYLSFRGVVSSAAAGYAAQCFRPKPLILNNSYVRQ
jgi:hypothetical protein